MTANHTISRLTSSQQTTVNVRHSKTTAHNITMDTARYNMW